jgi:tol-pal system protein YbgF
MALHGFRDFVQRFPTSDLADNAQYGIGECFFAQSMFDSASTEYARVDAAYPTGDRVPAALYKLALSQEKLKQTADAKKTLNDLVKRYPLSGEAQLARDRLGASRKR